MGPASSTARQRLARGAVWLPGLLAPLLDVRPELLERRAGRLLPSVLPLDQEARHEAASAPRRLPGEGTEPGLGDRRVVVLAEDVLNLLQLVHEPLGGVTGLADDELRGISRPLGVDSHLVQLVIGWRLRERPHPFAKLLELALGEILQR